jgi:hypothetical protein
MISRSPRISRTLRYCFELLFCLNLSASLLFLAAATSASDGFARIGRWKAALNEYLTLHHHSDLGAYLAILIWSIPVSVCIFMVVRLISSHRIGDAIIRWVAGVTTFAAMPLVWFVIFMTSPWFPFPMNVDLWVMIELCFAGASIFFILLFVKKIRVSAIVLILCLHFAFWLWMFAERFGSYSVILPIIGWGASVLWIFFIIDSSKKTPDGVVAV